MTIGVILFLILILALVGIAPIWPHHHSWGYGPSSVIRVATVVFISLFVLNKI